MNNFRIALKILKNINDTPIGYEQLKAYIIFDTKINHVIKQYCDVFFIEQVY